MCLCVNIHTNGFKQRLEYLEILKDNFETCNNENNDSKNINNNNDDNRTVNGETNNRLNDTSDRNNNDSSCRNNKTKNRNRKVIWFNPAFCKSSTINIDKYFPRLIDKHFNENNPLKKI